MYNDGSVVKSKYTYSIIIIYTKNIVNLPKSVLYKNIFVDGLYKNLFFHNMGIPMSYSFIEIILYLKVTFHVKLYYYYYLCCFTLANRSST